MRVRRAALVAVALLAACSGGDVSTRSAELPATTTPSTSRPVPTSQPVEQEAATPPTAAGSTAPTTDPSTSGTAASTSVPAGDPEQPSTSSGDDLYPELGSADLDVQSYDVRLRYDVATQVIEGAVTVTTLVDRPLDVIALDASQLTVSAVTVDGVAAAFEHTDPELLVRPATPVGPGEPVVIDVVYRDDRHETSWGFGVGSGWFAVEGGSYVINEPDGNRRWVPSNDHPSDKATWRFEVTVADGLTAVANGRLVEQRPGAGATTWVWEQDEPMATYLVQLLIGDYEILDGGTAEASR